MAAADAAEPDRAVLAARGDVAGFGAPAVRDSDLAHCHPRMLRLQQRPGLPPDPVAVPVELHCHDPLDRLTAASKPAWKLAAIVLARCANGLHHLPKL